MSKISLILRLSFGLAILSLSGLLVADLFGLIPKPRQTVTNSHFALCESLAVQCSDYTRRVGVAKVHFMLKSIADRNDDLLSIGLRRNDGHLLADVGGHESKWSDEKRAMFPEQFIVVPINSGLKIWGHLEANFRPQGNPALPAWIQMPLVMIVMVSLPINMLIFYGFLRRMMKRMNPSRVVPNRVRSALDSLAEGLLVLDNEERIVLANRAFEEKIGIPGESLIGRNPKELPWEQHNEEEKEYLPWEQSRLENIELHGQTLKLEVHDGHCCIFMVNSSPITDDEGARRGTLASFDDVTVLESKKAEMNLMLEELRNSRDAIQQQNEQLNKLATVDVLTECLNRRALFDRCEAYWSKASLYGQPFSCLMVDVDHFKAINDTHGHTVGDEVLSAVGRKLLQGIREEDIVARYGGEEFCILLAETEIGGAVEVADRLRNSIHDMKTCSISVSVSIGVASSELGATSFQEMIEQADKCLYFAKRNGRDQTARWDRVSKLPMPDDAPSTKVRQNSEDDNLSATVPFHAVSALLSSLAYRDLATAQHSIRVANNSVLLGREFMSVLDCYILEVAALLHDIGKIGVPDSILLKPGPLTAEEWKYMELHDSTGVEIIRSSFHCDQLSEIIGHHHSTYGGKPDDPNAIKGKDIPLGARILTIADAYDAMISDRVYRKGRSPEKAFEELRRCAGTQFDPDLVEQFIALIDQQNKSPSSELDTLQFSSTSVTRQCALQVGVHAERIAHAIDQGEFQNVKALSEHLSAVARKENLPQVAGIADELGKLVVDEPDLKELVETVHGLLDICRNAQLACLPEISTRIASEKGKLGTAKKALPTSM